MSVRPPITAKANRMLLALVAINVAIELILTASDLGWGGNGGLRQSVYQNGAFWAGLLHNWRPNYEAQPWTMFVSYAFLHGGLAHLAGNMLTLWILGRMVIARAGLKRIFTYLRPVRHWWCTCVWPPYLVGTPYGWGLWCTFWPDWCCALLALEPSQTDAT